MATCPISIPGHVRQNAVRNSFPLPLGLGGANSGLVASSWCCSPVKTRFNPRIRVLCAPSNAQSFDASAEASSSAFLAAEAQSSPTAGVNSQLAPASSGPINRRRASRAGVKRYSRKATQEVSQSRDESMSVNNGADEFSSTQHELATGARAANQLSQTKRTFRKTSNSIVELAEPEGSGPTGTAVAVKGVATSISTDADVPAAVGAATEAVDAAVDSFVAIRNATEATKTTETSGLTPASKKTAKGDVAAAQLPVHPSASGRTWEVGGGGSGDVRARASKLDDEDLAAARVRALQIKAALSRTMRAATKTPSAESVKLILAPMERNDAPNPPTEPLRGEPLPASMVRERVLLPVPVEKAADTNSALAAARRQRSKEVWVTLRPGERRRRALQTQLQPPPYGQVGELPDRRGEEPGMQKLVNRTRLRPELVDLDAENEAEDARPRRSLKRSTQTSEDLKAAGAGAATVAGIAAVGVRAAVKTKAERERVQRANKDFAKYMEGVAAAAAVAEREVEFDGGSSGKFTQQGQQQQWVGVLTAEQRRNAKLKAEAKEAAEAEERKRQKDKLEQANRLRDLADMFRNFARQTEPATAAAAMVAAISPAIATAAAAADIRNPLAGFFGFRRASDVQLILRPVVERKPSIDGGSGDDVEEEPEETPRQGVLRARPLPTRATLLGLMRPTERAGLAPYTRSVGLRIIRQRRPRVLRRPLQLPVEALELVGDGATMSAGALRAARRKAYFYRQEAPRRRSALVAATVAAAAAGLEGTSQPSTQLEGTSSWEVGANGSVIPWSRPYSLSSRTFKIKRRAQYADKLKRAARKASLDCGTGIGVLKKAGLTAPVGTASAGAADNGPWVGGGGEAGEGEEAEEERRGEYNMAAEVVNDMYEQIMGVRLPERAMYGKRGEALAALTPAAVKDQTRSWIEACGKEYALAFHAREPLLMTVTSQRLLLSLEAISRLLDLPPGDCVQAALRSPALIGLEEEQLQGALEGISKALDVGLGEAGRILLRCPSLAVRQSTFPVSRRVELLAALLPVSRDKLRQVLRQRPQLMTKSAQRLAAFMMSTSAALHLPLFDVSLMISGCPGVSGVSVAKLSQRLLELQRLAALQPHWRDQLAAISPPSLGRCLVAGDAAMSRLQLIVDRGLTDEFEMSSFKRVLTMSSAKFEAMTSGRPRRPSHRKTAFGAAAAAPERTLLSSYQGCAVEAGAASPILASTTATVMVAS